MESQTMCDTEFATTIKTTLATSPAFADDNTADADAFKNALEAAMGKFYADQLAPAQEALEAAKDADNSVAIKAQEAALDAARDELGNIYPKGYARLNKAVSGVENGTMTFQKVEFDAERDNDGALDADDLEALGIEDGDEVVVMVSHKQGQANSRYVLAPTETGHSACTCHDKVCNDGFPVCKHEIAWVIYQVTSPFLANVDTAVEETDAKTEDAIPTLAP